MIPGYITTNISWILPLLPTEEGGKEVITGKLKSGFSYAIEDHVLDNMELLDVIADVEKNPMAMSQVLRLLLGDEQKKALYAHLRNPENGNVPISAVSEAIAEIFRGSGNLKN